MQFIKKTSSRISIVGLIIRLSLFLFAILNKIDFPAPKKEIEKIITNENFKIVK